MVASTSAGTTLAITAAAPATFDVAGYDALSYTIIGDVESIPELGPSNAVVTFQPLNGPEQQHKGAVSYGQLQVPMAENPTDAGQTMVKAAAAPGNNALYAFCKVHPDGSKQFWRGRSFSARSTTGGASNVRMLNALIGVSTTIVEKPAA